MIALATDDFVPFAALFRTPDVSTGTSYGSNAFATPKPRCIPILTHANDDRSEIKYANPYKNCINAINI